MEYVIGAIAGAIFGGAVGAGKYFFLWRKLLNPKYEPKTNFTATTIYIKMGASYIINILTLLIVFLLRDVMPFDFVAAIIATAIVLSISSRVFSINKVADNIDRQESNIDEPK